MSSRLDLGFIEVFCNNMFYHVGKGKPEIRNDTGSANVFIKNVQIIVMNTANTYILQNFYFTMTKLL